MAAAGAGAIGSSLMFSVLRSHGRLYAIVLVGAVGVSASMFLLGNVNKMIWGIAVAAMLGFFASMVSIGSQSEVQMQVDNELRGRVMGLWTLAIIGGPAVGSIVAGALASDVGPQATLFAFAGVSLLLTILVAMIQPRRAGVAP